MINTIKFERRKLICRKSVNENKFDPKMKIVVLYILLFSVLCYCEDDMPDWLNPFKKGTCVKIFYHKADYYKNYCLENFPDYNNTLGVTTEQNDTILFREILNYNEEEKVIRRYCYEISSSSGTVETSCMRTIWKNCYMMVNR
ncbi:hypothetical protein JTB14_023102 [Gonioctena quinquepunctata]|nr:hypothetical protein JTB14_023102 [Gonioctena quinquepunctata]